MPQLPRPYRLDPPYETLRTSIQTGTRVGGLGAQLAGGGTVVYPTGFAGTPTVMLTPLTGSSNFGKHIAPRVLTRTSANFSYRVTGSGGTLSWLAHGPIR